MAIEIQRYLLGTCQQGSGDAFVQAQVTTDLLPENGFVYKVQSVDVEIATALYTVAADCRIQWAVTRDTKGGVVYLNDPDTMLSDGVSFALTTSGGVLFKQRYQYDLTNSGVYIAEPYVYCQVDSDATGASLLVYFRINYIEVKLSEVEILRILNNS